MDFGEAPATYEAAPPAPTLPAATAFSAPPPPPPVEPLAPPVSAYVAPVPAVASFSAPPPPPPPDGFSAAPAVASFSAPPGGYDAVPPPPGGDDASNDEKKSAPQKTCPNENCGAVCHARARPPGGNGSSFATRGLWGGVAAPPRGAANSEGDPRRAKFDGRGPDAADRVAAAPPRLVRRTLRAAAAAASPPIVSSKAGAGPPLRVVRPRLPLQKRPRAGPRRAPQETRPAAEK